MTGTTTKGTATRAATLRLLHPATARDPGRGRPVRTRERQGAGGSTGPGAESTRDLDTSWGWSGHSCLIYSHRVTIV